MTDKVQKIRKEVERLQNELIQEKEKGYGSDVDDACILELQNILTYIDSLQEETVSEELEDASRNYADDEEYGDDIYIAIEAAFKAGAKWQKEKEEPINEDLGLYINELSKQFPEVSFAKLSRIAVRVAKWQREQIQSDIELARDMWYKERAQYPSVKDGIESHAKTYSFNIESELFNQLTKEQQALWVKEIEQAYISGGEIGAELARDIRYPENSWSSKVIPTFY